MMDYKSISVRQLRQRLSEHAVCYGDEMIITDHVDRWEALRYPCRMDAVVLVVCLGGEMEFSVNLQRYQMTAHSVCVVLAGDMVQIHNVKEMEAYAVVVAKDFLDSLHVDFRQWADLYLDIHRSCVATVPLSEISLLAPYYTLMRDNMALRRSETIDVLRGLVRALSYSVISLMRVYGKGMMGEVTGDTARARAWFEKFMALLSVYHVKERSGKYYASRLCVTPNYLSAVIKGYTGRTMSEWIDLYVVTEAKMMLKNTDMSIQEISYRLNFTTQSSFGKYFKLQTGMGPKAYRVRGKF